MVKLYIPRGLEASLSARMLVSFFFFFFLVVGWVLQLVKQHNKIRFRQREARLSTVKTGFIFLYLFTSFHDSFTCYVVLSKVRGDLSVTKLL